LWDAFIREEMRQQQVSTNYKDEDDVPDLALIENGGRGGRKGVLGRGQKSKLEESNSSCQGKKDLSHIQCFMCGKHCHYVS
jgi:hypothetical protein